MGLNPKVYMSPSFMISPSCFLFFLSILLTCLLLPLFPLLFQPPSLFFLPSVPILRQLLITPVLTDLHWTGNTVFWLERPESYDRVKIPQTRWSAWEMGILADQKDQRVLCKGQVSTGWWTAQFVLQPTLLAALPPHICPSIHIHPLKNTQTIITMKP